MRFNVYGRFKLDVVREGNRWAVYRLEPGRRIKVRGFAIPSGPDCAARRVAAERWATTAHPDRAAKAIATHAEGQIRGAGASIAYLDASPNAEAFYARRGYRRVGEVKANNSIPMSKRLDLRSRDL